MNPKPERKYVTIAMDVPADDPAGIIWEQGDRDRPLCPARVLGEHVKAYVDELEDGESVELVFIRTDMTRAQINAIPEICRPFRESGRNEPADGAGARAMSIEPKIRCDCDGSGWITCPECFGRGYFVSCIDDLCHGGDYCIHGDGEEVCGECDGEGQIRCHCIDDDDPPRSLPLTESET